MCGEERAVRKHRPPSQRTNLLLPSRQTVLVQFFLVWAVSRTSLERHVQSLPQHWNARQASVAASRSSPLGEPKRESKTLLPIGRRSNRYTSLELLQAGCRSASGGRYEKMNFSKKKFQASQRVSSPFDQPFCSKHCEERRSSRATGPHGAFGQIFSSSEFGAQSVS